MREPCDVCWREAHHIFQERYLCIDHYLELTEPDLGNHRASCVCRGCEEWGTEYEKWSRMQNDGLLDRWMKPPVNWYAIEEVPF